jgi:hypothetical protein
MGGSTIAGSGYFGLSMATVCCGGIAIAFFVGCCFLYIRRNKEVI